MAWRRGLLAGLAALAFVYGAARVDLYFRARAAFREGEKWMEWSRRPELKKAHFEAECAAREAALARERDAGRLDARAYEHRVALARFERDQSVAESSLKYAFVWFQTAAELFSPPETRWTRDARARMQEARALWKKELDARKVPYQDYMLE